MSCLCYICFKAIPKMIKNKLHPCGLTKSAVRQHETGSRPLGKAGSLLLASWKEAERLRAQIKELQKENELLKTLIKN